MTYEVENKTDDLGTAVKGSSNNVTRGSIAIRIR